jgi:hypothetical protein
VIIPSNTFENTCISGREPDALLYDSQKYLAASHFITEESLNKVVANKSWFNVILKKSRKNEVYGQTNGRRTIGDQKCSLESSVQVS